MLAANRAPRCFATRRETERTGITPRRRRISRQSRAWYRRERSHRCARSRCRSSAAGSSTSATRWRRKSNRACNCRRRTRRTPRSRCASRTSSSTISPPTRSLQSRNTAMPTHTRGSSPICGRPIGIRSTHALPALASLDEEPAELFLARVRAAQEHIAAGDIYQANLSRRWRLRLRDRAEAAQVYNALAPRQPGTIRRQRAAERLASSRRLPSGCCASGIARFRRGPSPARAHARARPSRIGAIPPNWWRTPRSAPNTSC